MTLIRRAKIGVLSNNHVMATQEGFCLNETPLGTWILQPGTLDIGKDPGEDLRYLVGFLEKFVPFHFCPDDTCDGAVPNTVDAAIARASVSKISNEILGIGTPRAGTVTPYVGMPVIKSGRKTGVTTGKIIKTNCSFKDTFECSGGTKKKAKFTRQMVADILAYYGDSGSVILEKENLIPVGLLWSGQQNAQGSETVMNDIRLVYKKLDVETDSDIQATRQSQQRLYREIAREQSLQRMSEIQSRYEDHIFSLSGVESVCIGVKSGELAQLDDGSNLEFIIACEKSKIDSIRASIPDQLDGIPVRVEEGRKYTMY